MNNDILNIMAGGSDSKGVSSTPSSFPGDVDDVDDLLTPRDNGAGNQYYPGGLNLGRSRSAAPETWEYRKPSSSGGGAAGTPSIDEANGSFFGSSRLFAADEAGGDDATRGEVAAAVRRPASTGVIGRPSGAGGGGNDGDVNSILETLGLTSLESSVSGGNRQNNANSMAHPLGGIDSAGASLVMGHSPNKKSIMEKIDEGKQQGSKAGKYFTSEGAVSDSVFTSQGSQMGGLQGGINASSNMATAQQYQSEQQLSLSNQGQGGPSVGQQLYTTQYVQQTQQATARQIYQQDQSHYEQQPQQQQHVYYQQQQQQQQASQQNNYQGYGAQQQANLNIMGVPQQQTIYHINAPAPQYGFEYHTAPQQQFQHVLLPQQQVAAATPMHGQPQYISIVPLQAGPHVLSGAPGHGSYAYVQYGADGTVTMNAPPALVGAGGGPAAFVMGPSGPIAVQAAAPGVVSLGAVAGYSQHGSSPPGTSGRSPVRSRDAAGARTPDRDPRGRKGRGGSLPGAPRGGGGGRRPRDGKDAGVGAPSKLGPEAAALLNEIRAAKSRNQWTVHEIRGHVVEFCLDQNGSRFIQQRLEVADAIEKNAVMDEIVPAIKELQNDVFGNYVVQKLYEFGTEGMKKDLKGTLEGNMLLLSLQMYG